MIMAYLAESWLTMVPLSRSWQIMMHGTLVKITIVCHGSNQRYHFKSSIEPFSVIDRVPKWKACL